MQKTSQNIQTALDKSAKIVYNTDMNNNNNTTKENEMIDTITRLQTYQGSLVHVTSVNKFWNEATIYFVCPVGKQQKGTFKVGLPRLQKLEEKEWMPRTTGSARWPNGDLRKNGES